METCHCGRELHYVNLERKAQVEALIAKLGPCIEVHVRGRVWRVPRHYIALHGLKAWEVERLGFEEVERHD